MWCMLIAVVVVVVVVVVAISGAVLAEVLVVVGRRISVPAGSVDHSEAEIGPI